MCCRYLVILDFWEKVCNFFKFFVKFLSVLRELNWRVKVLIYEFII